MRGEKWRVAGLRSGFRFPVAGVPPTHTHGSLPPDHGFRRLLRHRLLLITGTAPASLLWRTGGARVTRLPRLAPLRMGPL